MHKLTSFFLLFLLLLSGTRVTAQTNSDLGKGFFHNWSISLSGGPNVFFGDIKEYKILPASSPINELRYAGTFSLNRQLSHVFMLRGQVFFGQLAGEKVNFKDGSPCNQYFESDIYEINLNTTINFSNLFGRDNPNRFFFVYGTVGAGAANWITKKKDITTNEIIATDGSWSQINPHLVIPAGLGAYFTIKNKVNLGLEWTMRQLVIDRLDATVGGWPYDAYSLLAFNITYNFDKSSNIKLTTASPQKQIGPPPPQPLLAAEIAAEKQKEKEAKEQAAKAQQAASIKLPPPLPVKDSIKPAQQVLVPDTTAVEENTETDTLALPAHLQGVSYRVQVFAFKEDTYSADQIKEKFNLSQAVSKEHSGGWYRYTIGSFTDLNEAKKLMTALRTSNEIPDAFIAKYVNGNRATPAPPHTVRHYKNSRGKVYYRKPVHKK